MSTANWPWGSSTSPTRNHLYENTAAIGNLSVLLGARGRPGRATSRSGGHQRGGIDGAAYPMEKSLTEYDGVKLHMDQDLWIIEGGTRMVWSLGNNWIQGSGATQYLAQRLREMTRLTGPQITSASPARVLEQLKQRVDNGGMFIVQSDIYLNDQSEFVDLVLPAATWGEEDFTRNNAERRLRLYGKIMDPPGEALPDWKQIALVAQKMGFEGFDWQDSNEIFEESGARAGGRMDYSKLVEWAQAQGRPAHDVLRELGTEGIQTPIQIEGDQLVGPVRLHADLRFGTTNGKSNFVTVDLDAVQARNELLGPRGDEFWVLSGRVNEIWQSMFDDKRKPHLVQRYPVNHVEINEADASRLGIVSGDMVAIESDRVRAADRTTQSGAFTAVAYVTDQVPAGVLFTNFHYPGSPANAVVTGDASSNPINPRQPFKFGRGHLSRIGPTELASLMSFAPRNFA